MDRGDHIDVRRADINQLDDVLSVLSEAAVWLQAKGIDQWPAPFPDEYVLPALRRDETYLAYVDRELAGTITVQQNDPVFWPDAPANALYIHRVAVRRQFAGLGRLLMAWAEHRVLSEQKMFLRLDCWDRNVGLRSYYEALGFEQRGHREVVVEGRPYRSALYEKRISQPPTS